MFWWNSKEVCRDLGLDLGIEMQKFAEREKGRTHINGQAYPKGRTVKTLTNFLLEKSPCS